jgi:hypothetical protein
MNQGFLKNIMDEERILRVKKIQRSDCLTFEDFDKQYNVDTFGPIEMSRDGRAETKPGAFENSSILKGSSGYQPTATHWLDTINEYFAQNINMSEYSFVDVGSGKGKVIFYNLSKNQNYKEYAGIEADKEYHEIASKNLETTNLVFDQPVFFINIDAREYDYVANNTIYYFFFPFDAEVFNEIINKNLDKMSNKNNYLVFLFEQTYEVEKITGKAPVFVNDAVSIYKLD